jgi:hypothetical protein
MGTVVVMRVRIHHREQPRGIRSHTPHPLLRGYGGPPGRGMRRMPYGDRTGGRPMLAFGAAFNQGGVGMVADKVGQRITRGDVEAVLQAFGNGGRVVLQHSRTGEGAPADFFGSHGSIRPFSGSPWDGAHFCADDWHVIVIADIEGGDASFRHADAQAIMDPLTVEFTLDGVVLATTRTSIKRFLNPEPFDLDVAYYFQEGRLMSPADLAVGTHTLSVVVTGPSGVFQDEITFFVDASGAGACG